jgi:hypothetical protein
MRENTRGEAREIRLSDLSPARQAFVGFRQAPTGASKTSWSGIPTSCSILCAVIGAGPETELGRRASAGTQPDGFRRERRGLAADESPRRNEGRCTREFRGGSCWGLLAHAKPRGPLGPEAKSALILSRVGARLATKSAKVQRYPWRVIANSLTLWTTPSR